MKLTITRLVIHRDLSRFAGVGPDPAWRYTDAGGAVHCWVGDRVPSLGTRREKGAYPDGESYNFEVYIDPVSGADVFPGTIPVDSVIPGLSSLRGEFVSDTWIDTEVLTVDSFEDSDMKAQLLALGFKRVIVGSTFEIHREGVYSGTFGGAR